MPSTCKVCDSPDIDGIEADGLLAVKGQIPWAEVARRWDLTHHKGVQNHMARHYMPPPSADQEFSEQFDPLVSASVEELAEAMKWAPAEVKPFYAIAIQNLRGLADTKPSQQHLINALKAIHEVTGMKMEQQLMLQFAERKFGIGKGEAVAAIEEHNPIDLPSEEV
jgi:hypothetical protein